MTEGSKQREDDAIDNSRRNLALALLGGVAGTVLSSGCAAGGGAMSEEDGDSQEGALSLAQQALTDTSLRWFDLIVGPGAVLTNTDGSSTTAIAVVMGYNAPGDGGGGVFRWHTTAPLPVADNGIVFGTSAAGRWMRVQEQNYVNVKWFGAKGDDTANDQPAIQAAIDALKMTGGVVFFPAGTYRITTQVALKQTSAQHYCNITLQGVGPSSCIKSALTARVNGFGPLLFTGVGVSLGGTDNYTLKNVGMRTLKILGKNEDDDLGPLAWFSNVEGSFVLDCHIETNRMEGLCWSGPDQCRSVTLRGNHAKRIGGWSASGGWGLSAYNIAANDVTMTENRSFQCAMAIEQGGSGGVIANNIFNDCNRNSGAVKNIAMSLASTIGHKRLVVEGNTIYDTGCAILASQSNGEVIITNNTIECCTKGIVIGNNGVPVVVRGNYLYDAPNANGQAIEHVSSVGAPIIIEGNTIAAGPTSPWAYAVLIQSATAPTIVRDNIVVGNATNGPTFHYQHPDPAQRFTTPVNSNIEYTNNIITPNISPPSAYSDAAVRYRWIGTNGSVLTKNDFRGLDRGTVLSTRRPSSINHSFTTPSDANTWLPTVGTWAVGDVIVNASPVELGSAGSKYIVEGWVCVAAGTPGTWVRRRVSTGN